MAKIDEVKAAIEETVPGRKSRGPGRVPKALLMALVAGLAAWASRLEPVRSGVRSAVTAVRTRVTSIAGRGDGGSATTPAWGSTEAPPQASESSAPADSTAGAVSGEAGSMETSADTPVGIGFDEGVGGAGSTADSIPADLEDGRPAGV